jgi:DnaK suppressor protein
VSSQAPHLDAGLIAELRGRLLDSREALLKTVTATDEEIAGLEAPGPGDVADRAASLSIASLISRLGGQDKRELDEIAAALRRLGSGGYGLCESCREPIELPRLRAVPAARFCLACQGALEEARP